MINLFLDNLDIIITILVTSVMLFLGLYIVPFLRNKGKLDNVDLDFTKRLLEIIQIILQNTEFKNKDILDKALLVVEVAKIATIYIKDLDGNLDIEKKKEIIFLVSFDVLNKLNIDITDEYKKLIRNTINVII